MPLQVVPPGSGPHRCQETVNNGRQCAYPEIDGMGYCFQHVPDDMLEEAETITGLRRCRHSHGTPSACRKIANAGTEPPMCKVHGANAGSYHGKLAAARVVEGRVADRLTEIMGEHGEKLMAPDPIGDPLTELLDLAAEIRAWKEIMRAITAYLVGKDQARYANKAYGEQIRAEVILYERALERLARILLDIGKLGIERRLAAIQQQQADQVDRALTAALTATGLDLVDQQKARAVLARELMKAS